MSPDLLKDIVAFGSIASAIATVATALAGRTIPWAKAKLRSRAAKILLGKNFSDIEDSIRYYVEPKCSTEDPSADAEIKDDPKSGSLFEVLDESVSDTSSRYWFLLADSGMGKTSALINYFARHARRWKKPFRVAVVPLGMGTSDSEISKIEHKEETVLFLDALDEDQEAIRSYEERVSHIIQLTLEFKALLITCRTQFFPSEADIPVGTGRRKAGPRPAGEPAEYVFKRIYISPFSPGDVRRYIRKRYPVWSVVERRRSLGLVKTVPSLAYRPMLLSHLDIMAKSRRPISCSLDVYEEVVEAWLKREQGFVPDANHLRTFSELAAVDMFVNSGRRGMERMPRSEIGVLAKDWQIPLDTLTLTSRSLLNRDSEGNYKFAHRTIMEYLCLCRLAKGDLRILDVNVNWTDQMLDFFGEVVEYSRPWLSGAIPAIVKHERSIGALGDICARLSGFCNSKRQWIRRIGNLSCALSLCSDFPFPEVVVLSVDFDEAAGRIQIRSDFHARLKNETRSYALEVTSREGLEVSVNTLFALVCMPESAEGRIVPRDVWGLLPHASSAFTEVPGRLAHAPSVFTATPKDKFSLRGGDQGRFPSAIVAFGSEPTDGAMALRAQLVRIWRNAGTLVEGDFARLSEL